MMLQIRNMESDRCIALVKNELSKLELNYKTVELGKVELKEGISTEKLHSIDIALRSAGLELIDDKRQSLIEKIKVAVYQLIYLSDDLPKQNFSDYISKKVNHDYTYISSLFSGVEGITIEKYIIAQKIERVKELLFYSEFSLSDIAHKLQYSSMAHLSNQFKKATGLTLSFFRQLRNTGLRK
jgi:YesN/AraC family two-component response regulator